MGRCLFLTCTHHHHHLFGAVVSRNAPSLPLRPDHEVIVASIVMLWRWRLRWCQHVAPFTHWSDAHVSSVASQEVQRQGKCFLIKALEKHNPQRPNSEIIFSSRSQMVFVWIYWKKTQSKEFYYKSAQSCLSLHKSRVQITFGDSLNNTHLLQLIDGIKCCKTSLPNVFSPLFSN